MREPGPEWNLGLRDRFGHLPVGALAPAPDDVARTIPPESLIGRFGIRLVEVGPGAAVAEMMLDEIHMNQRGIAQAGTIVALADAAAGWATLPALAEGTHFTTLELKTNLLGMCRVGELLRAVVSPVHVGSSTVVLEAVVEVVESDRSRRVGFFSCTQLVLKPRK